MYDEITDYHTLGHELEYRLDRTVDEFVQRRTDVNPFDELREAVASGELSNIQIPVN
jgi:hypothetical protein